MPRLLDLYCGAGGAGMGYHRAGFEVVGVDIRPQPRYPFGFIQADALEAVIWAGCFDAIHASPPCQRYSVLRHASEKKGFDSPDLIDATRDLLVRTGLPWVIENVPGAPMPNHTLVLCGSMFGLQSGGRQLRRHRQFETSFAILSPPCTHEGEAIGVYGGGPIGRYTFDNGSVADKYMRRGGYQGTMREKEEAMEIDWMNRHELNQSIPPAYTEYIGEWMLG